MSIEEGFTNYGVVCGPDCGICNLSPPEPRMGFVQRFWLSAGGVWLLAGLCVLVGLIIANEMPKILELI